MCVLLTPSSPKREPASRLDWVVQSCRLLERTATELEESRPFAGLTIGASVHLEPKTAKLMETLAGGGAHVVVTGNLGSTQAATVAWLRSRGIDVVGEATRDPGRHARLAPT